MSYTFLLLTLIIDLNQRPNSIVFKFGIVAVIIAHISQLWLDVAYFEYTLARHTFRMCLVNSEV